MNEEPVQVAFDTLDLDLLISCVGQTASHQIEPVRVDAPPHCPQAIFIEEIFGPGGDFIGTS